MSYTNEFERAMYQSPATAWVIWDELNKREEFKRLSENIKIELLRAASLDCAIFSLIAAFKKECP